MRKTSKYNAHKTMCPYCPKPHDSQKEARRCMELHALEKAGSIEALQTQVRIELIPAARYEGSQKERAVVYVADFVYMEHGKTIVEDVKGMKTDAYKLKRKLLKWRFCQGGDIVFRET